MARKPQPIRSDLGWSTTDRISVRGLDLPSEIIGHLNLGDMAFLELTGRKPTPQESKLFNAIAVTLVEHGMTPSAIAARMTIVGAPEALQAAVAAGLLGLGSVFVGSMEHAATILEQALPYGKDHKDADLDRLADEIVARHRAEKRILPGIGHPIHKPVDPRAPRLLAIAAETGFHGRYVELMMKIQARAEAASGRVLPMNATGAIGALSCEMGFPPRIVRGFGVIARSIGLVGHIMEEWERPMALEIWHRVDDEASEPARKAAGV
ncbi:MAG TPA: citryl-CoA lyase [Ramlibacter sp.]|nr:citryl-CoA lyase [Ramlibacter sp.]